MKNLHRIGAAAVALCGLLAQKAWAQLSLSASAPELALTEGLSIEGVGAWSRRPINVDSIVAAVVEGRLGDAGLGVPKAGETVAAPPGLGGEAKPWQEIKAGEDGAFGGQRNGTYVLVHVRSEERRVMMLEASGHGMVYENGSPRMGDPYGGGTLKLPVLLRKGDNALLFAHAGRGGMRAKLVSPRAGLMVLAQDLTTPDVLRGAYGTYTLGVPVVNATEREEVAVVWAQAAGSERVSRRVTLAPMSVRKVGVAFDARPAADAAEVVVTVGVGEGSGADTHEMKLRAVEGTATRKITFVSGIDGSVQYYGAVPPAPGGGEARPGLVLSLHGASVEAIGQAQSYAAKPDFAIICPTNRRPFGFDWEDWGRADGLEVLRLGAAAFRTDPARQYVTGHSMGGHGTWQFAAHYPGLFAAMAPSAGWLSFETYGAPRAQAGRGLGESPLSAVLQDAARTSDTPAMLANLKGMGVYILHGDADDNVPVDQARRGKEELTKLGIEVGYHEQPGAGHWWGDASSGAACVDWPAIFELFRRESLERPANLGSFATEQLDEQGMPKGSFKRAFSRGFALVYGTRGTPEENARSYAKARYDSEQWWYRGNGGAELVADTVAGAYANTRNLILYGNADVNGAWSVVAPGARVRVTRGRASVDGQEWTGEDLGVLAVLPQNGASGFLVGVVAGTGDAGSRSLERLPYFLSGTGFPEELVLRAGVWREGFPAIVHAAMPTLKPAP